jgi:NADPH-dependent curcumin reductase CurA
MNGDPLPMHGNDFTRAAVLRARPGSQTAASVIDIARLRLPPLEPGQVRVRNIAMSVDPYMRLCLNEAAGPASVFALGQPLSGAAVGIVEASSAAGFAVGDAVASMLGWREAFVADAVAVEKLDGEPGVPLRGFLSVLGQTGFTAYIGMIHLGQPEPGETVLVSGAGGAVGSIASQLARMRGAKVVALAGSDAKCAWLRAAGIDQAINYRDVADLNEALATAMPDGIDLYFDNVGGEQLEAAITLARSRARFVECGMISTYRAARSEAPRNLVQIIAKTITMYGFTMVDFLDLRGRFLVDMTRWIRDGSVRWEETVYAGLEQAPAALDDLFRGANLGKMVVSLSGAD